jgi:Transport and Golgi organisation 2
MCSVSLFAIAAQWVLTMNRDEARIRAERETLHLVENAITNYAYPVDLQSQGTWIAANAQGVTLALLNRYHEPALTQANSRGEIIPALIQHGPFEQVLAQAKAQNWKRYSPFDLVLVAPGQLVVVQWNGKIAHWYKPLDFAETRAFFITSSAERTTEVIAYRQQQFAAFLATFAQTAEPSLHILRALHLQQHAHSARSDILVARPSSHTKSICQVLLGPEQTQLRYWNAHALCALDRDNPALPEQRQIQTWQTESNTP